jgi:uncharacterized membrane protein
VSNNRALSLLYAVEGVFMFTLKLLTALGSALIAGVFFAFSTFVMQALAKLPPVQGIATMQAINITVINPLFMTVFLGTSAACAFLLISVLLKWLKWHQRSAFYLLIGALFYLVGTFGVTIVFNVPLNEALAAVKPESKSGASLWASYLVKWTFWNHVRTIAALVAAALLTIALREEGAM